VIHGKGKGVLRERIARFLSAHSAVARFRLGESWEGGTGVPVGKLK
jgi:dsDNA-specific endonuclease/ATPase MutS2